MVDIVPDIFPDRHQAIFQRCQGFGCVQLKCNKEPIHRLLFNFKKMMKLVRKNEQRVVRAEIKKFIIYHNHTG